MRDAASESIAVVLLVATAGLVIQCSDQVASPVDVSSSAANTVDTNRSTPPQTAAPVRNPFEYAIAPEVVHTDVNEEPPAADSSAFEWLRLDGIVGRHLLLSDGVTSCIVDASSKTGCAFEAVDDSLSIRCSDRVVVARPGDYIVIPDPCG